MLPIYKETNKIKQQNSNLVWVLWIYSILTIFALISSLAYQVIVSIWLDIHNRLAPNGSAYLETHT